MPKHKIRRVTVTPAENLDAALASGKRLQLTAGVYAVTKDIPDGVDVKGASREETHVKGRITYGSNSVFRNLKLGDAGYSIRNRAGATQTAFEFCQLRGGGGDGGDWYNLLLGDWGRSCSHITFAATNIECCLGDGNNARVTENAADGGAHVEYVRFDGCHFGVSNGVRSGCPRMDLEVVTVDLAHTDTVFHHGWSHIDVIDSVFEPSDWYNIDLADHVITGTQERASGPSLIRGNTLKGGKKYTICTESPAGVVIEGNTMYRGGMNTVKFGCGDMSLVDCATVIRGNTFDLDHDNGIALGSPVFYVKGGDNEITGNVVKASQARTLFAFEQARRNLVTGNTITVSAGATVFAGAASGANVTSPNTINGVVK